MQELKLSATQQLRRDLLEKFNDVKAAREAYEFIAGGEAVVSVSDPEDVKVQLLGRVQTADRDGVYLVTKDNRLIPYGNPADYVGRVFVGVGLKVGDMAIRIAPKDQKDVTLTNKKDDGETGTPYYCDDWDQARIARPDGKADTEHIKVVGTDIELAPDEYIPSLFELYQIFIWRKILDAALEFIGQEPFEDDWYWSSTEYSATHAWSLDFNNGIQNTNTKASDRTRVRPVSAL